MNTARRQAVTLHDVESECKNMRRLLPDVRVEMLHGHMPARRKEEVIDAFRSGDIDVLVATTVVEVGVDVPNATMMIVENGERFGLATLHQLRGRVGRGPIPGNCMVLTEVRSKRGVRSPASNDSRRLLALLTASNLPRWTCVFVMRRDPRPEAARRGLTSFCRFRRRCRSGRVRS